ncbi:MAG: OadG family transporter subunit [Gemmiger sp.]|uniref:OadG family transporter subunit n=1 Tax=Gemmiger sp. TaxID=2049027 RepID=UPI002E77CBE6|nr:OadG family transporter subunit [Gemmiger sp.]MEE0800597.1 OadG family transporter subunit [Gemmiger sp.]
MSNPIALLALEASDATVVVTSITLVFAMLVALCLIIMVEGKIFDALNKRSQPPAKTPPKAPARQAPPRPAPRSVAKASVPAGDEAIPGEVVAAIAAAVATLGGSLTIRGIRRAKKPASGSRRGVWGDAGVAQNTTPFI